MYKHILRWCGVFSETTYTENASSASKEFDFSPASIKTLNDIMEASFGELQVFPEDFVNLTSEDQLKVIVRAGLIAKNGVQMGYELFSTLWPSSDKRKSKSSDLG